MGTHFIAQTGAFLFPTRTLNSQRVAQEQQLPSQRILPFFISQSR